MRTRRAILFPAILTFAAVGAILAGSAASAAGAAPSPNMTYHAAASPNIVYHT
jgi:hypothetical protein